MSYARIFLFLYKKSIIDPSAYQQDFPMNYTRFSHERLFNLGLILVGWTLYGFFFASQNYLRHAYDGRNPNFQKDLSIWLTCGYSWAILTYPILRLARRFPFDRENWRRAIAVHVPASFFFSIASLMIFSAIRAMLGQPLSLDRFQNLFVENIHSSVLIYFGILGVRQAIKYLLGPGTIDSKLFPSTQQSQPVSDSKVDEGHDDIIDRPSGVVDNAGHAGPSTSSSFVERFSVKKSGRIVLINVSDIDLVTSEGNYVKLHANGTSHLLRETVKAMEQKLDPKDFVRVRRSTIVRIEQIKELHPLFNGEFEIVLKKGTKLSSSRRYRKNLDVLLKT